MTSVQYTLISAAVLACVAGIYAIFGFSASGVAREFCLIVAGLFAVLSIGMVGSAVWELRAR